MYDVSSRYKTKIKEQSNVCEWYGSLLSPSGIYYEIKNTDIQQGSGRITRECSDGDKVEIGTAFAAQADLGLYLEYDASDNTYYLDGKEVSSSYRLYNSVLELTFRLYLSDDPNDYEDVPCGVFVVSEVKRKANILYLTAYDSMLKFDKPVDTSLYPSSATNTAYDWIRAACLACGVNFRMSPSDFYDYPNYNVNLSLPEETDIENWRTIVGYACACIGAFAYIDRTDRLRVKKYDMSTLSEVAYKITNRNRYDSDAADFVSIFDFIMAYNEETKTDEFYGRGGSTDPSEVTDSNLIYNFGDNPFAQIEDDTARETFFVNLITYIGAIPFFKVNATIPSDPAFDVGDMIKFVDNQFGSGEPTRAVSQIGSAITQYTVNIGSSADMKCGGENPYTQKIKGKIGSAVDNMEKKNENVAVEELDVTANGTYEAEAKHAYNPVKVNVPLPLWKTLQCTAGEAISKMDCVYLEKGYGETYTRYRGVPSPYYPQSVNMYAMGYKDKKLYNVNSNKLYSLDISNTTSSWVDVTSDLMGSGTISNMILYNGIVIYTRPSGTYAYDIYTGVYVNLYTGPATISIPYNNYGSDSIVVKLSYNSTTKYIAVLKTVGMIKGYDVHENAANGILYKDNYMLKFTSSEVTVYARSTGEVLKTINLPTAITAPNTGVSGVISIISDNIYCLSSDRKKFGYYVIQPGAGTATFTQIHEYDASGTKQYYSVSCNYKCQDIEIVSVDIVGSNKDYYLCIKEGNSISKEIKFGTTDPGVVYRFDEYFMYYSYGTVYALAVVYTAYKTHDKTLGMVLGYAKDDAEEDDALEVEGLFEYTGDNQLNVTSNGVYNAPNSSGYNPVVVDIPQTEVTSLQADENGNYTSPEGQAYNEVSISVPQTEIVPLNVVDNDTYTAPEGQAYSPVTVNVPQTDIEPLNVTSNGTYTAQEGQAYSPVVVNVPQKTIDQLNVTQNGTYNAPSGHAYDPVVVNVPQVTVEQLDVVFNGTYTAPSGKAYSPVNVDVPTPAVKNNITAKAKEALAKGDPVYVRYQQEMLETAVYNFSSTRPQNNASFGVDGSGYFYFIYNNYLYRTSLSSPSSPSRQYSSYTINSLNNGVLVYSNSSNYYIRDLYSGTQRTISKSTAPNGVTVNVYGQYIKVSYRNSSSTMVYSLYRRNSTSPIMTQTGSDITGTHFYESGGTLYSVVLSSSQYRVFRYDTTDEGWYLVTTISLWTSIKTGDNMSYMFNGMLYVFNDFGDTVGYISVKDYAEDMTPIPQLSDISGLSACGMCVNYNYLGFNVYDKTNGVLYNVEANYNPYNVTPIYECDVTGTHTYRVIYPNNSGYRIWMSYESAKIRGTEQDYVAGKTTTIMNDVDYLGFSPADVSAGNNVTVRVIFSQY